MSITGFPQNVWNHLQFYVYRLIDPRNGETFYVGVGAKDRVFDHSNGAVTRPEDDEKASRIRKIHAEGFDVLHVIHRHGLDEATAYEVESALIDAYPGTHNLVRGRGSSDRGVLNVAQIIKKFQASIAVFKHSCLIIRTTWSIDNRKSIYDSTRFAWRLDRSRAEKVDYILSVSNGFIIDVFKAKEWLPATKANFPGLDDDYPRRFGFIGEQAPDGVRRDYINCQLPAWLSKKGMSNPISYVSVSADGAARAETDSVN